MAETRRKVLHTHEQKTPADNQSKHAELTRQGYLTFTSTHFHKGLNRSFDQEGSDQTHREDTQEL